MDQADDLRKIQSLVGLLESWANWQKGYRLKLSYPSKSAGFESGGYVSRTFDELAEESDSDICQLIDYAVSDLLPVQSAAIHKRYLAAVFRFERANYPEALTEAHMTLICTLPKKGVVI